MHPIFSITSHRLALIFGGGIKAGVTCGRITFRYQGREFRLTDVHGKVVKPLLA